MRNKNKYFAKSAKSVKKADYSYNGFPLKRKESVSQESQLYPDEKNVMNKWKAWSQLQSIDQIMPYAPTVDGKKMYIQPNEPTERLDYIRRTYPAEYQTNAFGVPVSTRNSLKNYKILNEIVNRTIENAKKTDKNKRIASMTRRMLENPVYQMYDTALRPYKNANAENESNQFYQNMFAPQKENAQTKQYASNYYKPSNMYSRANRDLARFALNTMTYLGYGKKMNWQKSKPKDIYPAEKVNPNPIFDI